LPDEPDLARDDRTGRDDRFHRLSVSGSLLMTVVMALTTVATAAVLVTTGDRNRLLGYAASPRICGDTADPSG
jgi:hypothetical protein